MRVSRVAAVTRSARQLSLFIARPRFFVFGGQSSRHRPSFMHLRGSQHAAAICAYQQHPLRSLPQHAKATTMLANVRAGGRIDVSRRSRKVGRPSPAANARAAAAVAAAAAAAATALPLSPPPRCRGLLLIVAASARSLIAVLAFNSAARSNDCWRSLPFLAAAHRLNHRFMRFGRVDVEQNEA